MKTEIEAKFLNISFDEIRAKLVSSGAVCMQPMRLMRRYTFHTPEMRAKNGYIRVRDEGNKVTFTYKQFDAISLDGAKEIEVTVSNFDDTVAILKAANHEPTSFQESRRETWTLQGVEVVLDEWPWLNPFIEIEGDSEQSVMSAAELLGFSWGDASFGGISDAFAKQYPHLQEKDFINRLPRIAFDMPLPEALKS